MEEQIKKMLINTGISLTITTVAKAVLTKPLEKALVKVFVPEADKKSDAVDPKVYELMEAVKANKNIYDVIDEMCNREEQKPKTKTQELKEKWGIK